MQRPAYDTGAVGGPQIHALVAADPDTDRVYARSNEPEVP
jgi:hypothetical protein